MTVAESYLRNDNRPQVSVVMSVFNGELFLHEAVESILKQSSSDFEFIIINDGSVDGTAEILDSYAKTDARVRIVHQENRGLVESLNRGCALANGRYIARMDADDIATSDRLQWQVAFMEEHPEVAVVGGAIQTIDSSGRAFAIETFPGRDDEVKAALLRGDCPFSHPTVMIRREILSAMRGYRKAAVDAEDYDLWARIADRHQLANLPQVLLLYRRHPKQVSIQKCRQQAISALVARCAAQQRRNGHVDPLDSGTQITTAMLSELGITESMIQAALCRAYATCVRSMCDAQEYSEALNTFAAVDSIRFNQADSAALTDLYLFGARALWHQGNYSRAIRMVAGAFLRRPVTLGRPFKPFLRKLGIVRAH
jgi:hypothetical protein